MNYVPGMYEAQGTVNIRREPRIVEYREDGMAKSNIVGKLTIGTCRHVFSVVTDASNASWGRISEADGAGIAEWVCLRNLNREFMKRIADIPVVVTGLEARVAALEAWARTQGFKG